MCYVNNLAVRVDRFDHAFHCPDKIVGSSKIGKKCDQHFKEKNPRNADGLQGEKKTGGNFVVNSSGIHPVSEKNGNELMDRCQMINGYRICVSYDDLIRIC